MVKRILSICVVVCLLCSMAVIPTHAVVGEIVLGGGAALVAILLSAGATVTFLDAARPAIQEIVDWFDSLGSPFTATVNPVDGSVSMNAEDYNNAISYVQEQSQSITFTDPSLLNRSQMEYLNFHDSSTNSEYVSFNYVSGVPVSVNVLKGNADRELPNYKYGVISDPFVLDAESFPDGTVISVTPGSVPSVVTAPCMVVGRSDGSSGNMYGYIQVRTSSGWALYKDFGENGLPSNIVCNSSIRDKEFRIYYGVKRYSGSPLPTVGGTYPIYGTFPKLVASNGVLADTRFQQVIPSNEELEQKKVPVGTGVVSWRPTTVDGNNALEDADESNAEIILLQSYLNGGGSSEPEPEEPDNLPYIPFLTGISGKLDGIKNAFVNWLSSIYDAIIEFKDRFVEWTTNLGQSIIDFKNSTATRLDTLINNFTQFFTVGGQRLGEWFEGLGNSITGFFADVRSKLDAIIAKMPSGDLDNPDNTDQVPGKLNQFFNGLGLFPIADLFGSIWDYVRTWVGTLAPGLAVFQNVWSHLPYAMVVPIYAAAVIVLVVGVFKRYIS